MDFRLSSTHAIVRLDFSRLTRTWISTIPFALAWIPAAAAILYLKFVSLGTQLAFDFGSLSLIYKVSLFRTDILFCFLLIPLGLTLVAVLLPDRLRGLVLTISFIFCILVSYVEARCFHAVGRLYSFNLLRDTIWWGWTNFTSSIGTYVNIAGLLRVILLAGFTIVISRWAAKRSKSIVQDPSQEQRWRKYLFSASLPLMVILVLPWLPRRNPIFQNESVLISALEAFWGWEEEEAAGKEFDNLGQRELIEQYQDLVHVRSSEKDPRYWSKAADSDVIFFIYETGPAAMLPIDGDLNDFPNLRRLRERAFVAPFHYSTYPSTNRALFSSFSGWYPASLMNDFVELYPDLIAPGIIRDLSTRGYQTASYSPFPWNYDYDVNANKALGFKHLSFAHESARNFHTYDKPWLLRESYDLDSLHLLESDVNEWLNRGEHFAVAFAPQLGHDPWLDVSPGGQLKNVLERGRPLMALQDAYLGKLVKLLEAHHRLEKTLIVVIGDHGVRTRMEDPDLQPGMVDDISFHVPMLLYAPQVLKSSVTISWVTSHIDLSPTLLDLFGVERERGLEQGSPIWDSHLQDRTVFFFARHYFAADGYYSRGQFFMWNHFFDYVYQNERQHFTSSNRIPRNSPAYYEVTHTIQRMVDLQQRWVAVFGRGRNDLSASPARKNANDFGK